MSDPLDPDADHGSSDDSEPTRTDADHPATDDADSDDDDLIDTEYIRASIGTYGGRAGAGIVSGLKWTGDRLFKNFLGFLFVFSRLVPVFGEKFWAKLAKRTLFLYHRRAGGDALGIEALTQEKADLTPVKYKPAEETSQDERPGWSAKGREKTWNPTKMGRSTMRLGKVPIIPLDNDSWQATSFAEARVSEAVDMGKMRPLYNIEQGEFTATIDSQPAMSGGSAVADGGTKIEQIEFDPKSSPIFDDMIIDLSADEYDGQAISFWKAKELMLETTGTEEMQRQEQRGFLAGRSKDEWQSWALRIMLIGAALGLGGLVGPELVNALLGSGGGGGGGGGAGIIPFVTKAPTLWG